MNNISVKENIDIDEELIRKAKENYLWEIDKKHYKTLGLAPYVDMALVKEAYRKLVKGLHPDVTLSQYAHFQFRKYTNAYEALKRPKTAEDFLQEIGFKTSKKRYKKPTGPTTTTHHIGGETIRSGVKTFLSPETKKANNYKRAQLRKHLRLSKRSSP